MKPKFSFKKLIPIAFIFVTGAVLNLNAAIKESCSRSQKEDYSKQQGLIESQESLADEMTSNLIKQFKRQNAEVVLLANVGLDVSDRSFDNPKTFYDQKSHKYMHSGIAYKNPDDGKWKIYHLLNVYDPCRNETDQSYVSNDKLRTFFTYAHHKMDILMSVPSKELQSKIRNIITSQKKLHNPNYSAIANPYSLKKQNSNQFILNVIATAQTDSPECLQAIKNDNEKSHLTNKVYDIHNAQLCYSAKGFEPTIIHSNILLSMGASIVHNFVPKVSLDDHSLESQLNNNFPFVSAASLFSYLKRTDPTSSQPTEFVLILVVIKPKVKFLIYLLISKIKIYL